MMRYRGQCAISYRGTHDFLAQLFKVDPARAPRTTLQPR